MQVVTKFGSFKIDNGGDTAMGFDAAYYHMTDKQLMRLLSLYNVLITHRYISTVINYEATKFGYNLVQDPVLLNIKFNYISFLIRRLFGHISNFYTS